MLTNELQNISEKNREILLNFLKKVELTESPHKLSVSFDSGTVISAVSILRYICGKSDGIKCYPDGRADHGHIYWVHKRDPLLVCNDNVYGRFLSTMQSLSKSDSEAKPVKPEPKPKSSKGEHSGGSVSYYQCDIHEPTTFGRLPYTAECNDIIEALDMTPAEANIFKEVWRTAAARTLGKTKQGHDAIYGAEKIMFFAQRNHLLKSKGKR